MTLTSVAKDKNIFLGRSTSSDPYVKIKFGNKRVGHTNIIKKTLDPVWVNQSFQLGILAKSIEIYKNIECHIFDHDHMSADDPMGTLYIPVPTLQNRKITNWYPVKAGHGGNVCCNATGELLVEVEVQTKS
jgi:Ca2+-dependent lipid-binding protein